MTTPSFKDGGKEQSYSGRSGARIVWSSILRTTSAGRRESYKILKRKRKENQQHMVELIDKV